MKRTATIILGVLVVISVGCTQLTVTGSGNVVTQEMAITGFDKVDISQGFQVAVSQGDQFSVVVRVDVGWPLWVEVTAAACRELQLEAGKPVFVLLKSRSLRGVVLPSPRP